MIDTKKISILRRIALTFVMSILLLFAYGIGVTRSHTINQKSEKTSMKVVTSFNEKRFDKSVIEDFLLAYYTKKELGENQNRYKPYLTDSLYKAELDLESESVNQAYKEFIVDFKYKEADIYVDEENLIALVKVRFYNTLLAEKDTYDNAQRDVLNEVSMKLTYIQENGKFLLNQKEPLTLIVPYEASSGYSDYGSMLPSADLSMEEATEILTNETEEDNGQEDDS